jgi:hypothetical protein
MGDSQETGISEFSEGSFFGTPNPSVHITVESPGIVIPEIITFISEQVITVDTMDISPQGSVHSKLTSEPVPPPVKTQDPSPVQMPVPLPSPSPTPSVTIIAMTTKYFIIDGLTAKVSTVQKEVTYHKQCYIISTKRRGITCRHGLR